MMDTVDGACPFFGNRLLLFGNAFIKLLRVTLPLAKLVSVELVKLLRGIVVVGPKALTESLTGLRVTVRTILIISNQLTVGDFLNVIKKHVATLRLEVVGG